MGILLSMVSVLGTEMKHLHSNKKKKNVIVSAAAIMLLLLATIILITTGTVVAVMMVMLIASPLSLQSAEAYIDPSTLKTEPKAPVVVSGDNIYVVWWTDKGTPNTNGEV